MPPTRNRANEPSGIDKVDFMNKSLTDMDNTGKLKLFGQIEQISD